MVFWGSRSETKLPHDFLESLVLPFFYACSSRRLIYSHMETPVGKLLLAATERGLRYIYFDAIPASKKWEVGIESPQVLPPFQKPSSSRKS